MVIDGHITNTFYSLIRPEPNYYRWFCTRVHGLNSSMTDDADIFPLVWNRMAPLIGDLHMVAHNARFDKHCLRSVMQVYQIDWPDFVFFDTLSAARKQMKHLSNHQLHTVSEACGFILNNHHNALADAEACAHIAIKLL